MGSDNAAFSKPVRAKWTLRPAKGEGWQLVDPDGRPSTTYYQKERALVALDAAQARTDARQRRMARPCMCCGITFQSDGIHNRLCARCRNQGGEWRPYGIAPRSGRPR